MRLEETPKPEARNPKLLTDGFEVSPLRNEEEKPQSSIRVSSVFICVGRWLNPNPASVESV